MTDWDDKYVFAAFTVTTASSRYGGFAWIFQVDKYNASHVYSHVRVARGLWDEADSGLYRAIPYTSVAGTYGSRRTTSGAM